MKPKIVMFDQNCAIREFTADGVSVGRCWFYVGYNDYCPRHGDVHKIQEKYRLTGFLTDDPKCPN